jgi:hypothetical protein
MVGPIFPSVLPTARSVSGIKPITQAWLMVEVAAGLVSTYQYRRFHIKRFGG